MRTETLREVGLIKLGAETASISGYVDKDGKTAGSELTCKYLSKGAYEITYNRKFSSVPIVVATPAATTQYKKGGGPHVADTAINVNSEENKCTVWTYEIDSTGKASPEDCAFNFITVGKL